MSWSAPTHDGGSSVTGYVVEFGSDASGYVTVPVTGSTSASLPGLLNATQYGVRVAATTSSGVGPFSGEAVAAAFGYNALCMLRSDGQVLCRGDNGYGQLGDGTRTARPNFVEVLAPADVTALSVGDDHSCTVHRDGSVRCWGRGAMGTTSWTDLLAPTPVAGITNAVDVSAAAGSTCALLGNGRINCWGYNDGRIGNGDTAYAQFPTEVVGITDAVGVSASPGHTCAVLSSGSVMCWGSNALGQLGDGSTVDRLLPTLVPGITDATAVATGNDHTCVLRSSGGVSCWGGNSKGQLGNGNLVDSLTPTSVLSLVGATSISSNVGWLTCATTVAGEAKCWGDNSFGAIPGAPGIVTAATTFLAPGNSLARPGLAGEVTAVTSNRFTVCSILDAGSLACGGWNGPQYIAPTGYTSPSPVLTYREAYTTFTSPVSVAGGCWVDGISTSIMPWTTQHTVLLNGNSGAAASINNQPLTIGYSFAQGPLNTGPDFQFTTVTVKAQLGVYNANNALVTSVTLNGSVGSGPSNGQPFPGETFSQATIPAGTLLAGSYAVEVMHVNYFVGTYNVNTVCTGNSGSIPTAVASNPAATTPNWWSTNTPVNVRQRTANFAADSSSAFAATDLSVAGPNVSVNSITGQRAGVVAYARAGDVLNVSGSLWTPSSSVDSVTVGGASTTHSLVIDASGFIAGTIDVPASAVTGIGSIVITQGTNTSSTQLTVLGARTLTLSPASAGTGTTVDITGSNWDPNAAVGIRGTRSAPPNWSADGFVSTVSSPTGTISASYLVTDPGTQSIAVAEAPPFGSPAVDSVIAPFGVERDECTRQVASGPTTPCATLQDVTATVFPGALFFEANAAGLPGYTSTLIPMGTVTSSTAEQTLTGQINPITVFDVRGGDATWSLTASMPNLTGSGTAAGADIAASRLVMGPATCIPTPDSATGITAGIGGAFGGAAITVCDASTNNSDSSGDTPGGVWVVDAPLTVTIPSFQSAGSYTSTITFSLI